MAWRQAHDTPQHELGSEGPFSFCSYPFLLSPRAKSKLLHTEARFLMTQVQSSEFGLPSGKLPYMGLASLARGRTSCPCFVAGRSRGPLIQLFGVRLCMPAAWSTAAPARGAQMCWTSGCCRT